MAIFKTHPYKFTNEYVKKHPGGVFHEHFYCHPRKGVDYSYWKGTNGIKITKAAAQKFKKQGRKFKTIGSWDCDK